MNKLIRESKSARYDDFFDPRPVFDQAVKSLLTMKDKLVEEELRTVTLILVRITTFARDIDVERMFPNLFRHQGRYSCGR